MSQWKNDDSAANSVLWGVAGYQVTANSANRDAFFGNTTSDAYVTGITVGQFGVDVNEQKAMRADGSPRAAHAGWNVRKVGSGGRAGRVQFETLVAMGSMTGDAEDTVGVDYSLNFTLQPSSVTINASSTSNVATFTAAAASTPSGATISYIWQKYNGSAFANLTNSGAYSNVTTAALSVKANTASTGEIYRLRIAATGATAKFSSNAVITITT